MLSDRKNALAALRRRWYYALLGAIIGAAVAASVTAFMPNMFSSSVSMYVATQSGGESSTAAYQGGLLSQQRVKTYTEMVASSARVKQEVAEEVGYPSGPAGLSGVLSASAVPDSVVFTITATDTDSQRAAAVADAAAGAMGRLISDLERPVNSAQPPAVTARPVEPATVAATPVSPSWSVNLLLGLVLGLGAGVAAAVGREMADRTVKDEESLQQLTSAPKLGLLPEVRGAERDAEVMREAFKKLRANVDFVLMTQASKVVSLTSSIPGEGKTTVVAGLASALAEAGRNVVVVDGDLRKPRLHEELGFEGSVGLTNVITGSAELVDVVQRIGPRLSALASGPRPPNPSEIVSSTRMDDVIEELRRLYEFVLIDTPPLLPVADGVLWASKSDGCVLVCRYGSVEGGQVASGVESLLTASATLLGAVLNVMPEREQDPYRRYGYYSEERSEALGGHHREVPGSTTSKLAGGHPSPTPRVSHGMSSQSRFEPDESAVTQPQRFRD